MFQLDGFPVFLPQLALILHVVLHQLCQRGKFFASIEVIVVAGILDFDVSHMAIPSAKRRLEKAKYQHLQAEKKSVENPLQQCSKKTIENSFHVPNR